MYLLFKNKMSINTKKGPVFESGQCRCCGGTKRCRLLNVEYEWFGQKEVYSDMFVDCFGLLLSNLDGQPEERLICATCVTRLREATCFRLQILECEEKLLRTKLLSENESNINLNNEVKMENIKGEIPEESDNLMDDMEHVHGEMELEINSKLIKRKTKKMKTDKKKRNKKVKINVILENELHGEGNEDDGNVIGNYDHQIPNGCKITENNNIKTTQNLLTIIENSYVCPFDTSFSDYFCVYCRQLFTDPNKLREHSLTHDPKTFKDINTTNKKSQIDIFRIDCRLCMEQIQDLEILKHHLVNTHGKNLHKIADDFLKFRLTSGTLVCLECEASFGFFHALKKHMAEHFGTCICDVCGAHYFEERMLVLHQKTHQRSDENFQCKECGKSFKSKYTRYIHDARMHKKEAAYQCNTCDEVFFSYTLRYRHMIDVHGEERMFQCEHCDRAYDSRKSLREHNRRFHLKILKHQCDLCDKRFYLPSRLKEHMASHTGERNFRCEYCGKSYPRLRGLKVHMQSHVSERKFNCAICSASFTQNVNLKNHIKRQHQNMDVDDNYNE